MTTYHVTVALDYLLAAPADECAEIFMDGETSQALASEEIKAHAAIMKAKGFTYMPVCDNPHPNGLCAGHTEIKGN